MALYIQIKDKYGGVSPVLYIHSDTTYYFTLIKSWQKSVIRWTRPKENAATPLGRLEAETAIIDLIRVLVQHYIELNNANDYRISSTFRLLSKTTPFISDDEIMYLYI